jgi:hypothetical protein
MTATHGTGSGTMEERHDEHRRCSQGNRHAYSCYEPSVARKAAPA